MAREILLIRGLPGSGKSQFARNLGKGFGVEYVEPEHFFRDAPFNYSLVRQAREWCLAEATRILNRDGQVIVVSPFTRECEIRPYRLMARHLGADLKIITLTGRGETNVPEHVRQKMEERWEDITC
jgi:adenylylsulfate kinase-like enzyme